LGLEVVGYVYTKMKMMMMQRLKVVDVVVSFLLRSVR
jgi:hypothetical protein